MPLDLARVASQVETMAASLQAGEDDRKARLLSALQTLHTSEVIPLQAKIERSKTTWLVAGLTGPLDAAHPHPSPPIDFTVVASDGSHIGVDRHSPARCFLINTGTTLLRYGASPAAQLGSQPTLYAEEEQLFVSDPRGAGRQPLDGGLLAARRAVEECRALLEVAREAPEDLPTVALLDGSLILWGLVGEAYPEYVREELVDRGLLPLLDEIEELHRTRGVALASYISLPRSTEVVNALRVALCPHDTPDCDRHCPRGSLATAPACEAIAGLTDRELLSRVLGPGERSSSFVSRSQIVQRRYRGHDVRFCYVRLEEEVARLEFPRWVEEGGGLGLLHSVAVDQCRRGHGYPVALAEAHEQAVINGADREVFQVLVESALADRRLPTTTSAKASSKHTRWV